MLTGSQELFKKHFINICHLPLTVTPQDRFQHHAHFKYEKTTKQRHSRKITHLRLYIQGSIGAGIKTQGLAPGLCRKPQCQNECQTNVSVIP